MQVLNALEHRYDNPSSIPARELSKLIYGADSVFARESTPASVRAGHAVHAVGAVVDQVGWYCELEGLQPTACNQSVPAPQPQCLLCSSTPRQIKGISAEDVRAFLSTWERPDGAVLGIVGDFEPRQVWTDPPPAYGRAGASVAALA